MLKTFTLVLLSSLAACVVGGGDHEDKFTRADGPKRDGRYIVQLAGQSDKGTLFEDNNINSAVEVAKGAYVVDGSELQMMELAADVRVQGIIEDALNRIINQQLEAMANSNTPWHLDRIDQSGVDLDGAPYAPQLTGRGVNVYVMDTGVLASHTELGGRVRFGTNTATGRSESCETHGTSVAGLVASRGYGVAPGATIIDVNTFDCSLDGAYISDTLQGINWIKNNAEFPAVANMSLGIQGRATDAVLNQAIKELDESGVIVVVAAGNEGVDACTRTFSSSPNAITAGAVRQSGSRYGNFGECVDLFAPGVNIQTISNESNTGTRTSLGTSFASPLVAGAVALLLEENPGLDRDSALRALLSISTKESLGDIGANSPDNFLRVPGTVSAPPTSAAKCQPAGPVDASGNDADGWGWDGSQSCRLVGKVIIPPTDSTQCDYSNAAVNGGWGWNPVTRTSCPPR